jgi:hypothetical protein
MIAAILTIFAILLLLGGPMVLGCYLSGKSIWNP